jgi:plasmid stabilization system protein ParE
VIVRIEPQALERIDTINAWWREHRPHAPNLFDDELDACLERLPNIAGKRGFYTTMPDGTDVWRELLKRSQQHVYYWIDDEAGIVHVISVWGAKRGSRPPLFL